MNSFTLSLNNELYKLSKKKKYIVILILSLAVLSGRIAIPMLIKKITSGEFSIQSNIILDMLPFTVQILVPVIVILASVDLLSGEFNENTMKGVLIQPITRFKVLFSKALAIFILSGIYFTAMYLICLVMQLLSGAGLDNALTAFIAYALDLIPVICLIGLGFFINMIVKSPSLATLTLVAIYAVMMYLTFYSSSIGQTLFTSYLQWHKLIIGTVIPTSSLITKAGIIFGSALILFSLSYIMFDKRDV